MFLNTETNLLSSLNSFDIPSFEASYFFKPISQMVKGALNPNFLDLTKNRENFCL